MFPKPLPLEAGCLSVLIHAGTFPSALSFHPVINGQVCQHGIPVLGTIGTNDPAIWRHVIWGPAGIFTAELKCDISGHHGDLLSLMQHCASHPHVWKEVRVAA